MIAIVAASFSITASAQKVIIVPSDKQVVVGQSETVLGIPKPVVVNQETKVRQRRNLPPGHAKKVYGHQSAKAFAPGQQKKRHNKNWVDNDNNWNSGNDKIKTKKQGRGKGKNKD